MTSLLIKLELLLSFKVNFPFSWQCVFKEVTAAIFTLCYQQNCPLSPSSVCKYILHEYENLTPRLYWLIQFIFYLSFHALQKTRVVL